MRAILLTMILLGVGATGCLGTTDDPVDDDERPRDGGEGTGGTTVTDICRVAERSGTITPTESLVANETLTDGPLTARVDATAFGAGTMRLVLERNGTEVWSGESPNAGDWNPAETLGDLEGGEYTLTASIDAGQRDVDMRLRLTVGNPDC